MTQQAFRHVRKLQREAESGILGVGRGEEGVSRDGEGAGRWEGIRRPSQEQHFRSQERSLQVGLGGCRLIKLPSLGRVCMIAGNT